MFTPFSLVSLTGGVDLADGRRGLCSVGGGLVLVIVALFVDVAASDRGVDGALELELNDVEASFLDLGHVLEIGGSQRKSMEMGPAAILVCNLYVTLITMLFLLKSVEMGPITDNLLRIKRANGSRNDWDGSSLIYMLFF